MPHVVWVGVDLAKTSFVAARRHQRQCVTAAFSTDAQGLASFAVWLPQRGQVRVVFEPTGPYGRPLEAWLDQHGRRRLSYALANPRRVRNFARAAAGASKTDEIDARRLLEFAETFQPPAYQKPSAVTLQLRALWRHQLELRKLLDGLRDRRQKAQVDPYIPARLVTALGELADRLATELAKTQTEALALAQTDSSLARTFHLLVSIPGVGPLTALALLAEYGPQIAAASPRQLTRYAGLDPVLWQSGSSIRKKTRISKQGNHRLRRALYMAALVGVRWNPVLRAFYQRRLRLGLPKMPALIAAMRKLLHICYGVLKNNQPFVAPEATP
jgi:transposase